MNCWSAPSAWCGVSTISPTSITFSCWSRSKEYQSQDQDASALRALEEAYKLSRNVTDQSTRALAACALGTLPPSPGSIPKRAQALIREGFQELPNESQFVLNQILRLECGSRVSRDTGEASEAVAPAQTAEQLLEGSPVQTNRPAVCDGTGRACWLRRTLCRSRQHI